ncbi:MAG: sigma-54-dependent Fis family transcriptional regulator [Candidatus Latescibacteria bacterium]|nr:sigma-54-dependent Fis family transcriptional regulator [Candidatus Latescibacterota bacterium]MBT5828903.1 sigma-54-dependent Fis family transcriptional regulator [Candidatus Latescibacterota bacterium]
MSLCTVLVVDDEPDMLSSWKRFLGRSYTVETAENGKDGLAKFEALNPDLVITDLRMPSMDGFTLLQEIKKRQADAQVIVLTGYGTIEDAVRAMDAGAYYFLQKNDKPERWLDVVERALKEKELVSENKALKDQLDAKFTFDNIIGKSAAMQRVFDLVSKIANTQANVLITGDSGTGKELVARSIHANSNRKGKPFVALNCGGLPEHLVESELFGHERGAFTGANAARSGLMEHADTGTFFLDEIGELPMHLQVKFLRVLEERSIRRLGSNRELNLDIRLISATNQNLETLVPEGEFREDLYYRINTFVIHLPPLRERLGDIPLLANHFLKHYSEQRPDGPSCISEKAMAHLEQHAWRGNVRELQHAMERAVTLASGDEVVIDDLPENLGQSLQVGVRTTHFDQPFKEAKENVIEEFERAYVQNLLRAHNGNISKAAQHSGIDRRSLHRLLAKHEIDARAFSG